MRFHDFRVAVRSLRANKGFTATVALTLALGISATTSIFSVVYGVLLRPLPYRDSSALMVIQGEKAYSTGPRIMNFSAPELEPFAAAVSAFSSVAISSSHQLTYRTESSVEAISSAIVSGDFFSTLGTAPLLGRTFGDESAPNIVISERLWGRLFNRAPDVVGRTIRFTGFQNNERLFTIVGVMPHEFQYPRSRTDVWRPLGFARAMNDDRVGDLAAGGHEFIARIKHGISFEAAAAEATRVVDAVLKPNFTTSRTDMYAKVTPLREHLTGAIGPALWILMGAVLLVLLVACANVANLTLARQSARAREIGVRLALGAPRGRLLAAMTMEVAVLAVVGAGLGIAAAFGAVRALRWLPPAELPMLEAIEVDLPVLLFATIAAAFSVVVAGLIPGLIATRSAAALAPGAQARRPQHGLSSGFRATLIVAEIAVTIVLLVGAALLSRSLQALMNVDVGASVDRVVAATFDMALGRNVPPERQARIAREIEERVSQLPSVRSAGIGSGTPPAGEFMRVSFIFSNGNSTESHIVTAVPASPGYLPTLQMRLLSGRWIDGRDVASAPRVVVLNREAATRFFHDADPIGRTLPLMGSDVTVIGVVNNVKYTGLASRPEGVIYLSFAQQPLRASVVLARTDGDPLAVAAQIRDVIRTSDAGISVPRVQTLTQFMSDAAAQPRFRASLTGVIALVALVLAMIGLYGVLSYTTAQRTTEIAVRMAIGARHTDVVRMVLRDGLKLALAGLLLGLLAAYWSTRLIEALLFEVRSTDAVAFTASALCLLGVALLASYVPAARAARVDPIVALRTE